MYELDGMLLPPAVDDLLAQVRKIVIPSGTAGSWMCADKDARAGLEATLRDHWPEVGPILYMTVVYLYPGAQIQSHCDAPIQGIRYHIPLQQNDGCWSFSEGVWQQLQIGRIYTLDPSKPHGAVNWGPTLRVNLLIDVQSAG